MRNFVLSSLIIASALGFVAPAGAQAPRMHRASVMMRHVAGPNGGYYAVQMNGTMYAMIPMATYDHLLEMCKERQQC